MKITLIYPRFKYQNVGNTEEPLGILYIAAVLKKAGHDVAFYDLTFTKELKIMDDSLRRSSLVGLSSSTPLFGIAKEVLSYVKKINPAAKTVIGGPHATQDPVEALSAGFDFAVIGEGEDVILELVRGMQNGDCSGINSIAYNDGSQVKINPRRSFIQDLDAIPGPERSLLDYSRYFTFGIMATRGCPFNCFYCKPMQDKLFGNRLRKRSIKGIVDEMEELTNLDKNKVIYFKDDTLTVCPDDWFGDFRSELKKRGLKPKWGCNSRVDTINKRKLGFMKESGCVGLSFGVESGSQRVIDFYNKGTRIGQAVEAFELCHKLKIKTLAFIMLGAPIETRQDMEETYRLVRKIKPDQWIVYVTTPFPGNYLHEYAKKRGIINIKDYLECDNAQNSRDLKLAMTLDHLSKEDIKEYRDKINRYMIRRSFLVRIWWILTRPSELKKLVFQMPKAVNLVKILLSRY